MKRLTLSLLAAPLLVGGLSTTASAADGISILDNVKVNGQIRPRYEYADVDNNLDAGQALTSRIKLNASANLLDIDGLTTNIGLIGVYDFGWRSENGFYQSADGNPVENNKVVDPATAMLSNLELNYTTGKTTFHAGRGQVNLDNQRFIGTVGWRQLERSYDTVFVANNSIENLSVLAAWVYAYEGVAGTAKNDTNSILLHASYKVMDELTVTLYDYMLASIHDTYGIALTGKIKTDGAKISYRAEYAMQTDATMEIHDQEANADASYYNLDIGANLSGVIVGANYEFLSGASGNDTAFSTPLGTNHKFNGWADVFLFGTGGYGLNDMNLRVGYAAKGFGKVLAVYHQYTADVDGTTATGSKSDDLGSEIDVLYANGIPGVKNLKGLVKAAFFSGGDIQGFADTDVTKFWVQLDYKFATK